MQVSKSWRAAVDSGVKHLAEGTQLPRDLATRFLSLRSLDLEYCDHDVPAEELVEALLSPSNLQGLLNVNSLEFMINLTSRTSLEDLEKVNGPTAPIISNRHVCTIVIDLFDGPKTGWTGTVCK